MGLCEAVNHEFIPVLWIFYDVVLSPSPWYSGFVMEWQPLKSLFSPLSIFLMKSTWLPSVHSNLLITNSLGHGLGDFPLGDPPPLHSLQNGQDENFLNLKVCLPFVFKFHAWPISLFLLVLYRNLEKAVPSTHFMFCDLFCHMFFHIALTSDIHSMLGHEQTVAIPYQIVLSSSSL